VVRSSRLVLVLVLISAGCLAQTGNSPERKTSRYFASIRQEPSLLLAFLRDMPKGGDLHSHLSGAIYAESLVDYAAKDGLCLMRNTNSLASPPCDVCDDSAAKPAVSCAYSSPALYNSMIDAWSMRNWRPERESGHDHFFATFDKFGPATHNHGGDVLAEVVARAAADHVQYLELMQTADGGIALATGKHVGWDDDLAGLRHKLLAGGLKDAIPAARKTLDEQEARMRDTLKCQSAESDPGCDVTVRYLYQVLRGMAPAQVFAQILTGFELAQADPRFVGLNLVMPEDWYVPMRDFELHMKMLDYLHGVYPNVHISLHAGELAMGLVPPEGLRFHIRESVEKGHAERIGHGVDVMNETDPLGLLREMAQRNVLVEICLTSNDVILGVKGKEHPLPMYRKYGVPVALATDDEGVSRSDMTHEYLRAATTYDLSYADLKQMARQSLEHSFLPGGSVWSNLNESRRIAACGDSTGTRISPACRKYLAANDRARAQWKLEEAFARFESKF